MSKPNNSERPAKRPMIDVSDNESTGNQPTEKSVRRDDKVVPLSEEILAIHHKAAKLEKDKQGAIRIAADAQSRVEFLENIIDKKRTESDGEKKHLDELQKKVIDLTEQLKAEQSRANEAQTKDRARIDELMLKLSEATDNEKRVEKEHQEKISSLTRELEVEKSKGKVDWARINELTRKQAQAAGSVKRLAKEYHEKIDELTREFAHREDGEHQQQPSKGADKTGIDPSTGASSFAKGDGSENSTNIFDVHYTEGPISVAFPDASRVLFDRAETAKASYGVESKEWLIRLREACKDEKLYCSICEVTPANILFHFLSAHKSTVEKARETAYVSLAALEHWLRKLDSITKKPAATAAAGINWNRLDGAPAADDEDDVAMDENDEEEEDDGNSDEEDEE